MGCCAEAPRSQAEMYAQMPDSTLMCLARMTYQLACVAEQFYTGRERVPWTHLSEEEHQAFLAQLRPMVEGRPPPREDLHALLSFKMLHALTATV